MTLIGLVGKGKPPDRKAKGLVDLGDFPIDLGASYEGAFGILADLMLILQAISLLTAHVRVFHNAMDARIICIVAVLCFDLIGEMLRDCCHKLALLG
jgi:hypothetical protein